MIDLLHAGHHRSGLSSDKCVSREIGCSSCTNIIEAITGSVRRVCRNIKRWRDASMALRWTAAAMIEAAKGLRRLKAKSQLPRLRAALSAHRGKADPAFSVAQTQ
jgi:Cys-tRNA synthase (O-phospho-L-seryl-tRNA:Cys-tRNA synthase)